MHQHARRFNRIARQIKPRSDVVAIARRDESKNRLRADSRFRKMMKRAIAAQRRHAAITAARNRLRSDAPEILRARREREIRRPIILLQIIRHHRLHAPRPPAAGNRIHDDQSPQSTHDAISAQPTRNAKAMQGPHRAVGRSACQCGEIAAARLGIFPAIAAPLLRRCNVAPQNARYTVYRTRVQVFEDGLKFPEVVYSK